MFNQYIKIGIKESYYNNNYSKIIECIGAKFCNEISGSNYNGNKGRRKIIQLIKSDNAGFVVSKSKVKAFCNSANTLITRKNYLKIPRHESIMILNAIIKLIEDDKNMKNILIKYCNDNKINDINRIYRTALIPKHYNELKNNVINGALKKDEDADNLYSDLRAFTKKIV